MEQGPAVFDAFDKHMGTLLSIPKYWLELRWHHRPELNVALTGLRSIL